MSKVSLTLILSAVLSAVCFSPEQAFAATALKICKRTSGATGIGNLTVRGKCKKNEAAVSNISQLEGDSFYDTIPSGTTVSGIIGGDFDTDEGTIGDWRVFQSFPAPIGRTLHETDDVIVANTSVVDDNCVGDVTCLSAAEAAAASACTGTTIAPTAPAGKVCIYPYFHANARDIDGYAFSVTGETSTKGFYLDWSVDGSPRDTYLAGVWAYTQP